MNDAADDDAFKGIYLGRYPTKGTRGRAMMPRGRERKRYFPRGQWGILINIAPNLVTIAYAET